MTGMEGNIFGIIIFLPLIVASAIYGIVHIINTIILFLGYYDVSKKMEMNKTNRNSHLSPWETKKEA